MAGVAGKGLQARIDAGVIGLGIRTARVKVAARGPVDEARRRTRDRHQLFLARAVEARDRLQQPPRVGVLRRSEQLLGGGRLDDPAGVHHGDVVGHLRDHTEVVSDDHDRHPQLALEAFHQRQDLRLHGHVERRRRLVRDQQLRVIHERHRDHRPLAHAPRELVRVLVHAPRRIRDTNESQQIDRPRTRRRLRDVAVRPHRLYQLGTHPVQRVQRGQRVLKDHRNVVTPDRPQPFFGQRHQVLALEQDPSRDARALAACEPERRQRRDRLARPRLADDPKRAPLHHLIGDAVDGVHDAILARKLNVQILDA